MKKWPLRILFILSAVLSMSAFIASTSYAANSGAILMTGSGCDDDEGLKQNVNSINTTGNSSDPCETPSETKTPTKTKTPTNIPPTNTQPATLTTAPSATTEPTATSTIAPTATSPVLETPFPQVTVPPTNTIVPTATSPALETPFPQVTVAPTSTLVPTMTSDPGVTPTNEPTTVPQQAPVTGGPDKTALLQGAAIIFALISIGSYALLKKKVD